MQGGNDALDMIYDLGYSLKEWNKLTEGQREEAKVKGSRLDGKKSKNKKKKDQ